MLIMFVVSKLLDTPVEVWHEVPVECWVVGDRIETNVLGNFE